MAWLTYAFIRTKIFWVVLFLVFTVAVFTRLFLDKAPALENPSNRGNRQSVEINQTVQNGLATGQVAINGQSEDLPKNGFFKKEVSTNSGVIKVDVQSDFNDSTSIYSSSVSIYQNNNGREVE